MKVKIFVVGLICLLLTSFLLSQKIDFTKFTPEDCAKYIEKRLRFMDYNFLVTTNLKNGKIDFHFNLKTPVKDMNDVEDFTMDIVILVGELTNKTSWKSNKAIVFFKDKPFFWIYTKDCREAIKPENDIGRMEFITARLHYFKK